MPNLSPNEAFNDSIAEIVNHLPNVSIKRNTPETIINRIEFEFELEEQYPFTRSLFDDISLLCEKNNIGIESVAHLAYRERYTFRHNQEMAVLDFEYKSNGVFGRILPVLNKTNSQSLVLEIKTALQTLKQEEHAV
jgi:hypothetical protein